MNGSQIIVPAEDAPEVWESVPFAYAGSTITMTANTGLSARVSGLPRGGMLINRLAYLCVSAVGNVEMLITKSTAKNGLTVDAVLSTGAILAAGSNAIQELTLPSNYLLENGDLVWVNPSGALQIRVFSSYATIGALKNRLVTKSSLPHPWSGQQSCAASASGPYVAAYFV